MRKKEQKNKSWRKKKRTYQTTTLSSDLIAFDEEFENIAHENRPKGCLNQVGFQQLIHLFFSASFSSSVSPSNPVLVSRPPWAKK